MTSMCHNVVTSSFYDVDVLRRCNVEYRSGHLLKCGILVSRGVIFLFEINMIFNDRLVFDVWISKSTILT